MPAASSHLAASTAVTSCSFRRRSLFWRKPLILVRSPSCPGAPSCTAAASALLASASASTFISRGTQQIFLSANSSTRTHAIVHSALRCSALELRVAVDGVDHECRVEEHPDPINPMAASKLETFDESFVLCYVLAPSPSDSLRYLIYITVLRVFQHHPDRGRAARGLGYSAVGFQHVEARASAVSQALTHSEVTRLSRHSAAAPGGGDAPAGQPKSRQTRTTPPAHRRVSCFRVWAGKYSRECLGSGLSMNQQSKPVVVRVQRGCTCCGCGCVVPTVVVPVVSTLLWGSMGSLAAVAVGVSAAIGGVHAFAAGERLLRRPRMHRAER